MTLETRIARLERQARLYRNLFLASLLVLVAFLSLGQTSAVPDAVQGHSFVVVDRETGAPLPPIGRRHCFDPATHRCRPVRGRQIREETPDKSSHRGFFGQDGVLWEEVPHA